MTQTRSLPCPSCGESVPAHARFCARCGAQKPPTAPGPSRVNDIESRSIVLWLILCVLTCGIAFLVWYYCIANDLRRLDPHRGPNAGLDLLLLILTVGLYGFWTSWNYPEVALEYQERNGLPANDMRLPCLLLWFFGVGIGSIALMQNELNHIAEAQY